jgi:predicted tellurium resistance membrane protein TerC
VLLPSVATHGPSHLPPTLFCLHPLHAAVDNLFVFILVFNYFKTPPQYQRKVLTYGIATAAILRLVLIVAGVDIGECNC